jgi:hypothetical protein
MFESRVLWRIFGPKRDEATGGWRTLRKQELHNLYSSPCLIRKNQVREDEMNRACSTHGNEEEYFRILVEKSEGNRPLGKPTRMSEDNIKIDLR